MEDHTTPNRYRELAKVRKTKTSLAQIGIETQKNEHDADDRRPKTHENKTRKKKAQALQRKTERESNEFGGKIEFVTKRTDQTDSI